VLGWEDVPRVFRAADFVRSDCTVSRDLCGEEDGGDDV
jgi:hypothetical protein